MIYDFFGKSLNQLWMHSPFPYITVVYAFFFFFRVFFSFASFFLRHFFFCFFFSFASFFLFIMVLIILSNSSISSMSHQLIIDSSASPSDNIISLSYSMPPFSANLFALFNSLAHCSTMHCMLFSANSHHRKGIWEKQIWKNLIYQIKVH